VALLVKDANALDLDELVEYGLKDSGIKPVLGLVAEHSWWVSPKVYREIQVVYPETRRKRGTRETRGQVIDSIRIWYNEPANHAFWMAMGQSVNRVKNFNVCHIYERSVWDPRHFTNLANLCGFPMCLESLSEWRPVRDLLKYHSFKSYGYKGPNGEEPSRPSYYPPYWRHQVDPSREEVDSIVWRLKAQMERRPQFRGWRRRKLAY